jgi:thiamine biosynthesis lipoprotein
MIKKLLAVVMCMLLPISLGACSKKMEEASREDLKMDTIITIKAYGPNANEAVDTAYKRIDEIEQMASRSIDTSDVNKINQAAGKEYVKVHTEIIKMIEASVKYSKLTNGAFDITVSPIINLWGIGTVNERVPSDSEIKMKLPLVGYNNISIDKTDMSVKLVKEGMSIDLGGIAKGFAADEVVKVFKKYSIKNAIINIGGSSVYTFGEKQDGTLWSVGIQHPRIEKNDSFAGIIRMPQQALSTSGDYQRYFMKGEIRYHHIINPATGYPADAGVMSDTILIDSSIPDCNMLADILTKVTFVSGIDKGFKVIDGIPGVSCLAVTTDNKIYKSSAWKFAVDEFSPEFTVVN